jgi:serine/threonine protein kinase
MPTDLEIEIIRYYPPGVTTIIASSFSCFLGRMDEDTVLKYPHDKNPDIHEQARLNIEAQIYTILGEHDRIIKFKGGDGHGIRLEYAVNGSVSQYLRQASVKPTTPQRLRWAQQAAEGMAYIHKLGVLHCDINVNNLLLDQDLNIKFADFQGRYLSSDGTIILDGLSSENVKSSMPRSDPNHADQKTDIFALGSAIYYMMTGHEPFPELNPNDDDDEAEIVARYKSGQFPVLDPQLGGQIIHSCWVGAYGSASEVADDFQKLIETTQDV